MGSFLLLTIAIASLIVLDFDNDSMLEQLVGFIVFFSIIFYGIITTFMTVQKKIDQSSDKHHDVVNMFNGLYLSMESEDSMDELREQMRNIKAFLTGKKVTDQFEAGNHVKNLKALLYETLEKENKDNELILDLGYFVAHEKILFGQLILILGTLFDNALEHGGDHPIFIELNVSQKIFELTVKNSCEPLSEKQMKKMFKKGYTTKESVGNGKGLYNLEQEVKKHQDADFNAMITTSCDYNEEYESYYLSITVDITHKTLALKLN
jgi:signal transduction histidine kinase